MLHSCKVDSFRSEKEALVEESICCGGKLSRLKYESRSESRSGMFPIQSFSSSCVSSLAHVAFFVLVTFLRFAHFFLKLKLHEFIIS